MGRSRRLALLQLSVSAVALGAVVWWASRQSMPPLPGAAAIPSIAAALGLYAIASLLRGERWMRLVRQGGVPCGRRDAYALTTVGYMGNNALPARAGDLLKSFLTARRAGAAQADVLGILVAERLLDVAALALLFAGLVTTLRLPVGIPGWMLVVVGIAVVALAAAAALATRHSTHGARLRDLARVLGAPTRRLWSRQGAALLLTSLAVWLVEGSVYAVLGGVAAVHLSLLDGLYIMALANLVALVPAAPGYVGTFDAAVILGLGLVATASRPQQLAYVLIVRFVLFIPITLVGLVALVVRYGGLRTAWAMRTRLASP
jgi:uncharacterized membrane protein YbhN (UPF0104 family)